MLPAVRLLKTFNARYRLHWQMKAHSGASCSLIVLLLLKLTDFMMTSPFLYRYITARYFVLFCQVFIAQMLPFLNILFEAVVCAVDSSGHSSHLAGPALWCCHALSYSCCHEVLAHPPRQRLKCSGGLLAVLHVVMCHMARNRAVMTTAHHITIRSDRRLCL